MQNQTFQTPEPVDLFVEIGSGSVHLRAADVDSTEVSIDGKMADDVTVTHDGRAVRIVGPKSRGIFSNDHRLEVQVTLPSGSDVTTRTGSAGVTTVGSLRSAELTTGSGSVEGESFAKHAVVKTGSGAVRLQDVAEDVRVKTGSGAVEVGQCRGSCGISTGSGAVRLGSVTGDASVKTGSGNLSIESAGTQTSFKTGSGDTDVRAIRSGTVNVKGASGDVTVGVPDGTPVWADVSAVSGAVRNDMPSVGAPQEGQPHVELHITTVSGDIAIRPV